MQKHYTICAMLKMQI